jgi:RNA polymerase-binding protein DksA
LGADRAANRLEESTMADRPAPPEDQLAKKAAEVERLREFIDSTSFSGSEEEVSGELSNVDQHPADSSDVVEQRARDFTIRQMLDEHAEQIQAAQERQAEGQYGICQSCGQPISPDRLKARPEATLCIDCQRSRETHG